MRRGRVIAVLIASAVGLGSAAHSALLSGKRYPLDVPQPGGGYKTEAYIYEARSVTIFALLKGRKTSQRDAVADSVSALAKDSSPYSVVVNGGFSSFSPNAAAGLLMVNGRVVSPLSLAVRPKTKDLRLAAWGRARARGPCTTRLCLCLGLHIGIHFFAKLLRYFTQRCRFTLDVGLVATLQGSLQFLDGCVDRRLFSGVNFVAIFRQRFFG